MLTFQPTLTVTIHTVLAFTTRRTVTDIGGKLELRILIRIENAYFFISAACYDE